MRTAFVAVDCALPRALPVILGTNSSRAVFHRARCAAAALLDCHCVNFLLTVSCTCRPAPDAVNVRNTRHCRSEHAGVTRWLNASEAVLLIAGKLAGLVVSKSSVCNGGTCAEAAMCRDRQII